MVPHTLVLEHVSPATRLLEKRRQMFEVQEALEQQKQEFNNKVIFTSEHCSNLLLACSAVVCFGSQASHPINCSVATSLGFQSAVCCVRSSVSNMLPDPCSVSTAE